jgi:hypothetical protein
MSWSPAAASLRVQDPGLLTATDLPCPSGVLVLPHQLVVCSVGCHLRRDGH